MAKTQTFGDKMKKKKLVNTSVNIKVIKGMKSETGSMRLVETFVRVNDLSEIDKIDFNK
jgi:hypothetical protein